MLEQRISDSYVVPVPEIEFPDPIGNIWDRPYTPHFQFPGARTMPGLYMDMKGPDEFFPMPGAATGIDYGNLTGLGGDVHDTFKNDRYGNTYGGHTSFQLPGGIKENFDWEDRI